MKKLILLFVTIASLGFAADRIDRCDASPNFEGSAVFFYPIGSSAGHGRALAEFYYNFGHAHLRCFLNETEPTGECTGHFWDISERIELKLERLADGTVVANGSGIYAGEPFTSTAKCRLESHEQIHSRMGDKG